MKETSISTMNATSCQAKDDLASHLEIKNQPGQVVKTTTQDQPPYTIFCNWELYTITGTAAFMSCYSSISVSIYVPALIDLEQEFGVNTEKVILFPGVSVFHINLGQCLMVALFPEESLTASAVLNVVRCRLCAVGLAVLDRMIESLDAGGTFTLFSGIISLT